MQIKSSESADAWGDMKKTQERILFWVNQAGLENVRGHTSKNEDEDEDEDEI